MNKETAAKDVAPLVLVVDDSAVFRMQAVGFLSQGGFQVIEAEDGNHAFKILGKQLPDLILLDVEMPGINGIELCSLLRKDPRTNQIPILILTGLDDNDSISQAFSVGATDFANKPINWHLLVQRLYCLHRASLVAARLTRVHMSLESAQRIAKIGSWQEDLCSGDVEWSDFMYRLLELSPHDDQAGMDAMLSRVPNEQRLGVKNWYIQARTSVLRCTTEHHIKLSDGRVHAVRHEIEPEIGPEGDVVRLMGIVQDVTDRKIAERHIRQLEYYDTVTSLPNRSSFKGVLESEMQRAENASHQLAILNVGLDDFNRINDVFGHEVGDSVLRGVAERLKKCLRSSPDSQGIARASGNVFIILLNGFENAEDVQRVSMRIIDEISKPFKLNEKELFATPSIGIALFPKDGNDPETLLKKAAIAMSEAKKDCVKKYQVHTSEMQTRVLKRYEIDARLHMALEAEEFSLHYQPQVDVQDGDIYCAEALIRWNSSVLGMVSPLEFISVAEENGIIVPIGEWVLRTACLHVLQSRTAGLNIPRVAVNVSTMQFEKSDFPSVVESILAETGLPPSCLELEITESLLMSDNTSAAHRLNRLSEMGVTLSVDDFGTGFSSLGQLKNFPIDRLKIDRSFISNLPHDKSDIAITRSIIAMAQSMNIKVLAEGVETVEQLEFLQENGCDEIQGYLISKPLSAPLLIQSMPKILNTINTLFPIDAKQFPKAV